MGLEGTWYNELCSTLVITSVSADGVIAGTYTTAVSSSGCAKGQFIVAGCTDIDAEGGSSGNVGFCVSWENDQSQCGSVTSWSGQLVNGQIIAFWLLTIEGEATWQSTLIGQDIFTTTPPTPAQCSARMQTHRKSHP